MDPVFLREEKSVRVSDPAEDSEASDELVSADPEPCDEGTAADPELCDEESAAVLKLSDDSEFPFNWADPCPPHAERARVIEIRTDMRIV